MPFKDEGNCSLFGFFGLIMFFLTVKREFQAKILTYFTLSCILLRLTENIKYNSKKIASFAFLLKDESQTYADSSDKKK